jgi:hypothetical protein
MVTGAAISGVTISLLHMTIKTAAAYEAIGDMSERFGIAAEFISRMNYVGQMTGVSMEQMGNAMKFLTIKIGDATTGTGPASDAFKALNINLKDTTGHIKTAENLLPELADRFSKMSSSAEKAAFAQALMSRGGTAMIPILQGGREELKRLWQEAEKYGLVVSTQAAANGQKFMDSMDRMKGSITGLKNKFAEELMPYITSAMQRLADLVADNREAIIKWAKDFMINTALTAEKVITALAYIVDAYRGLEMIFDSVQNAGGRFTGAVVDKFAWLTENIADLMNKANESIGSAFIDKLITKGYNMTLDLKDISDDAQEGAASAAEALNNLIAEGMDVDKVKAFVAEIRTALASLKEGGTATPNIPGTEGGDEGLLAQQEANKKAAEDTRKYLDDRRANYEQHYNELLGLHDQYTLQDGDRLTAWYDQEKLLFAGNRDALAMLDETYRAQRQEQTDEILAQFDEQFLNEDERLTVWYGKQQLKYKGNQTALDLLEATYGKKQKVAKATDDKAKLALQDKFYTDLQTIGAAFGKKGLLIAKALSIPHAIMSTWEAAANALATVPYPYNIAAAAAIVVQGFMYVANIVKTDTNVAHGGLEYVPAEQTYLLAKGERVLSPMQNVELMEYLESVKMGNPGGGGFTVQNLNVHILENATDLDAMRMLTRGDWQDLVMDKIVPALTTLKRLGVEA